HGARFVGCNVMFLEDGTRSHFMKFLEREFPSWLPRYETLYEKKYAPEEYRKQVQGMIRVLQNRYGLTAREREPHPAKHIEPKQSPVARRGGSGNGTGSEVGARAHELGHRRLDVLSAGDRRRGNGPRVGSACP